MQEHKEYALVTGASGGIGRQFAALLAREGWPVILVGRNEARLLAAKADLAGKAGGAEGGSTEVVVMAEDLSVPGAAARLHAACRERGLTVGLLVNNAGSGVFGECVALAPDKAEAMVTLNVSALTNLCALFGSDMKARGRGRILNVSSFTAFNPTPYFGAYAATKSYVLSYSLALRAELKAAGVAVTCLLPGYVRTDFDDNAGVQSDAYRKFSSSNAMSAESVARIGLAALARRKAYAIAGGRNKAAACLFSLLPRTAPPAIMKLFLDRLV